MYAEVRMSWVLTRGEFHFKVIFTRNKFHFQFKQHLPRKKLERIIRLMDIADLTKKTIAELTEVARELNLDGISSMKKQD